ATSARCLFPLSLCVTLALQLRTLAAAVDRRVGLRLISRQLCRLPDKTICWRLANAPGVCRIAKQYEACCGLRGLPNPAGKKRKDPFSKSNQRRSSPEGQFG